jgi:hypothetical protein
MLFMLSNYQEEQEACVFVQFKWGNRVFAKSSFPS